MMEVVGQLELYDVQRCSQNIATNKPLCSILYLHWLHAGP